MAAEIQGRYMVAIYDPATTMGSARETFIWLSLYLAALRTFESQFQVGDRFLSCKKLSPPSKPFDYLNLVQRMLSVSDRRACFEWFVGT